MRASGDWLRPTFNAEPRYHKPVLIYWLMMAGTALGGDNPFGARLVSALAGTGTCLVVLAWGRRMLGDRVGLWAALILATAPIVVVESKLATTDATLAFLVVGCQFALWELARGPSKAAAAVFWSFLALATLTKGPVGPALIVASAGVSWWWGGPTDCWKTAALGVGPGGLRAADGPLVRRHRAGLARRFLPGHGRPARHPSDDDGDGGPRGLPRAITW